jgi:lipopolysaccharide export system ATP-binding protein
VPSCSELRADNISKFYRGRRVLDSFSTRIKKGRVLALLGRNGSGKTTAFRIISGAIGANGGRVLMIKDGVTIDLTASDRAKRARLGVIYLPQDPSVFASLTVWQNIELVLQLRFGRGQTNARVVEELAKTCGIWHIISSDAGRLSGGERRKVEIVRSLALQPEFLMLDEPFAGVDPIFVSAIQSLIATLAKNGVGVVITDHNAIDTLAVADEVQVLENGKVCFQGDTSEAITSSVVRNAYLGPNFQG